MSLCAVLPLFEVRADACVALWPEAAALSCFEGVKLSSGIALLREPVVSARILVDCDGDSCSMDCEYSLFVTVFLVDSISADAFAL